MRFPSERVVWEIIIPILLSFISGAFGVFLGHYLRQRENFKKHVRLLNEETTKTQKNISGGLAEVLLFMLDQIHEEYVVKKKPIPRLTKIRAKKLYERYHALGGNGLGTQEYKEIMGLPQVKEDMADDITGD